MEICGPPDDATLYILERPLVHDNHIDCKKVRRDKEIVRGRTALQEIFSNFAAAALIIVTNI